MKKEGMNKLNRIRLNNTMNERQIDRNSKTEFIQIQPISWIRLINQLNATDFVNE